MSNIEGSAVSDGDRINPADIAIAVTRAPFTYENSATQVFTSDGRTVYTDNGGRSSGEWKVDDDGRFQSFWPPSEFTSYEVFWIVGSDGKILGVRFTDPISGATFDGRYTPKPV